MKTIGRIFIILAVFSALAALMTLAVNASGSTSPDFEGAPPQFRAEGENEARLPGGQQRFDRDRGGEDGGFRWMFGLVKNLVVIGLLVTLIVLPKNLIRNKRKQAAIRSANGGTHP
ncbi:MAG: hypothetical protein LDL51_07305 [Chloroflexi bacterium]|nr:hypothetical protein [Chloroflexota bacterium]